MLHAALLLLCATTHALRVNSFDDVQPAASYEVFHASDTPNFDALLLSAFRGASAKKLPEPFQSGIERIDLKRAVQLNVGGRNETDALSRPPADSGNLHPAENDNDLPAASWQPSQLQHDRTDGPTNSTDHQKSAHWWQRLLGILPASLPTVQSDSRTAELNQTSLSPTSRAAYPSQSPNLTAPADSSLIGGAAGNSTAVTFIELPSDEGVWDELDNLAAKTGLVYAGSRPYAFQYDVPHGNDDKETEALWIGTLNHSVLAVAHGPNFPIILALISLCGGSMMVTLITLISSPDGKFGDIIRIMNITLYGVLGALLAMYFKCGRLLTASLTIAFALFPSLSATKRLPSLLTKVTGGLGRFIDLETFLAVRISVTIFSSLCVQGLLSVSLVIFGSDRLSEHIARHLASSQILFAALLAIVAASTILPLLLEIRRIEADKGGMALSGSDFVHLNTFIHVIVSLAFGVVVVGTVSHLHNYLVYTTHRGEIMLFDPLVFFVPFSTSLFRWYNLLALLAVWTTAAFVFLATAEKAWILQLDNSFSVENNLIETLNGTLREETISDDEDDNDHDLLLIEPTPKIVPPPDALLLPPSPPPSELDNFTTPLSP